MMKNAIRLLVLAGALLSVGALAQNSTAQTWHFKFPTYAYVFTNVTDVYFDFSDDTADGDTQTTNQSLSKAGLTGFNTCISASIAATNANGKTFNAGSAASQDLFSSCTFAPSGLKDAGTFSVDWGGNDTADAALLVVTNASTYQVDASVSGNPTGAAFLIARKLTSQVTGSTDYSTFDVTNLVDENTGMSTQYYNAYVAPLSFAVQVSGATAAVTSEATYTVTYTVTAP